MYRRQVLVGVSAGLAGCSSRSTGPGDPGEPTTEAPTETTPDSPTEMTGERSAIGAAEEIGAVLANRTEREVVVSLRIEREDALILNAKIPVADRERIDPGIDKPGRYEIEVTTESGPGEIVRWSVEEYDLRAGSNVIAEITAEEIRILIEE